MVTLADLPEGLASTVAKKLQDGVADTVRRYLWQLPPSFAALVAEAVRWEGVARCDVLLGQALCPA